MLANSYLILGPNEPTNIASAAITQRHTIPLVWAFLTAADGARFVESDSAYYFELNVDGALKVLDRGAAGWNYNRYFRDTLAPVTVFRKWLENNAPDTPIYINVTELIRRSPTPHQDISSLKSLGNRVNEAFKNIEDQEFSHFINDLRALAHPFITVPITGDRQRDVYILTFEVRDSGSVEAEMALQMVGVDRDKSLLVAARQSIPELLPTAGESEVTDTDEDPELLTLFAPIGELEVLKELLVGRLGMSVDRETPRFVYLASEGHEIKLVKLTQPELRIVENETNS